jgi:hypothetical protein
MNGVFTSQPQNTLPPSPAIFSNAVAFGEYCRQIQPCERVCREP